ncbi:cytochrome P450 [Phenylobacterium sp. J367]|uniref:cytochrome P450 n=1 Tax=Phenylobacterium sp. J367 TaxID=2898435 RepID=UPI002151F904|nr:cytochrome P450 [Phenylobacterium sp. J367]MCR5879586.1 cytochrome P450 [Phenylobacterium sp. J367]
MELCAMFVVLLFAGHETTTNLIGTGLLSLLQHRDQWDLLCAEPDLMRPAVEELVRYVSPVQYLGRHMVAPVEIEGIRLEAGDSVLLMIAAANRDPEVFDDPDRLNIRREGGQFHLGFGMGAHVCLGSHLARMEAVSAFRALSARYPDLSLARVDLAWRGNAKLRSLAALPVHLGAARTA